MTVLLNVTEQDIQRYNIKSETSFDELKSQIIEEIELKKRLKDVKTRKVKLLTQEEVFANV